MARMFYTSFPQRLGSVTRIQEQCFAPFVSQYLVVPAACQMYPGSLVLLVVEDPA